MYHKTDIHIGRRLRERRVSLGMSQSELAGICFAPDGSTLFVNIQHDGLTLAIIGPFQS